MSEEYEVLKAQKDELDKKSRQQYIAQGAAEERARIRLGIERLKFTHRGQYGTYVDALEDIKKLLKDGGRDE